MGRFGLPVAVFLVVAAMIGLFVVGNKSDNSASTTDTERLGTKHPESGKGTHIAPGQSHEPYNSNLPSSGPHYGTPESWGIKGQPIADETVVHNLEHGGVWIAYKPDLTADQVDQLKAIVEKLPQSQFGSIKVILAPREANIKPVQLAAWGYTLDLDRPDEAQIKEFYEDHVDKGPELVP